MSDSPPVVERWQAPYFEATQPVEPRPDPQGSRAMAQAQGFQLGKNEGLAAGRAEAEQIVASLTAVADQMAAPFSRLDAVVGRELARLAMVLAERIVRRELALDSAVVSEVAAEALSTLYKLEGEVVIFLNPADAQHVRDFSPESLEGKSWKIVEDPALHPGGCQVKTPTSFVDASVEQRIGAVFEELLKSVEKAQDV